MQRAVVSIWFLLGVVFVVEARDTLDFNTINNETYRLFLSQDWDSVIILGNKALKQDIDYYYLRMRMGISFYHQKNYRKAAVQFTRALDFNNGDPVALEYLYFSRLLAGQAEQAGLVRKQFKGDLAHRLPPLKGKFADRIRAEFLYFTGITDELLSDPDLFTDLPPGVQNLTLNYSNTSLSLFQSITPGFSLTHTYTYLSKTNHYYYNDGLNLLELSDQHVNQHQYYISPVITTLSGYTFNPMFHLLSVHYQAPVNFDQGFQGGTIQVTLDYFDEIDYVTGLVFSKGIGILDVQVGGWYATLNNKKQVQNRLGITCYPVGNLNLYTGGALNSQYETADSNSVFRIIPELYVGFAISEKVWFDLNAAMGEMTNYLEHNGSIIFNSFSDIIDKKLMLTVSVPVSEKGSLVYLGGRWTSHQSDFYPFDPEYNINNPIYYNALSIYGGVSWKF